MKCASSTTIPWKPSVLNQDRCRSRTFPAMSFTVPRDDLVVAIEALEAVRAELGIGAVAHDSSMGKVSIVGAGMKSHPGVAAKTFSVLGEAGVNIEMISTSPIKISCVIRSEAVPEAVQALHEAFQLSLAEVQRERPIGQEAR